MRKEIGAKFPSDNRRAATSNSRKIKKILQNGGMQFRWAGGERKAHIWRYLFSLLAFPCLTRWKNDETRASEREHPEPD